MDSKINLLAEKIKSIDRNEEVIGRTLVAMNDRVKKLEAGGVAGAAGAGGGGAAPAEVKELREQVEKLAKSAVTREEFQQLRYVIETINPLEYATIDQVRELVRELLAKKTEQAPEVARRKSVF